MHKKQKDEKKKNKEQNTNLHLPPSDHHQ